MIAASERFVFAASFSMAVLVFDRRGGSHTLLASLTVSVYYFVYLKSFSRFHQGHRSAIRSLGYCSKYNLLFSGGSHGAILIWSCDDFKLVKTMDVESSVLSFAFIEDHVFIATRDNVVKLLISSLDSVEILYQRPGLTVNDVLSTSRYLFISSVVGLLEFDFGLGTATQVLPTRNVISADACGSIMAVASMASIEVYSLRHFATEAPRMRYKLLKFIQLAWVPTRIRFLTPYVIMVSAESRPLHYISIDRLFSGIE